MGAPEPSSAEAVGAYSTVCFCQVLGIQNLIIKGDAQVVTKAICSKEINMSRFGHVVADTQNVMQSFRAFAMEELIFFM